MGLPHLLPLAIERLREDPLASGDFFAGDLLLQVLRVPTAAWREHGNWRNEVVIIAGEFFTRMAEVDESVQQMIRSTYAQFISEPAQ
jgi:hypothetical protein